ncbi:MalY/PatB family protein [Listeria sp. PSOL-1]|uniref:MalY/PatB family protein n=1 Tax=Listeria sp. PSOL-1 TaxID=1844999 RepID=UPI0018D5FC58|nr:PatB family C-S lyase [Listeria sp. PSOL-1]
MKIDFDQQIDRTGTYSTQWDYTVDRFGRSDILPFSISDTDFAVPDAIQVALNERMKHPVYGYTRWNHEAYKQSIISWFEKDPRVKIRPSWIVYSPSVMYTISKLICLLTKQGEGVAVFTPMYDAFFSAIEANKRLLLKIELGAADQGYQIDWSALEHNFAKENTKVFLLTNPHNPTGKVFSPLELKRMNELSKRYNVFIISDDIHRDIILGEKKYTPITCFAEDNVALCCSSSKTFNTPGLGGSYAFIPNESLREKFLFTLKQRDAVSSASIFGIESMIAGYTHGEKYVQELQQYLKNNFHFLQKFLAEKISEIDFEMPEATYLAWLNVSDIKWKQDELQNRLINRGHVGIMPGSTYGDQQYLRMNIGCPLKKLEEGLNRMEWALHS